MTIFLLMFFDWWLGAAVLSAHPLLLLGNYVLGLLEFHLKGWLQFAAIMRLRDAYEKDRLSGPQRTLAKMFLFVGYLWDVGLNVLATFWLLQLPFLPTGKNYARVGTMTAWDRFVAFTVRRQWLLSQRLEYNVYSGKVDGWRKRWSETFRRNYLDNVDSRGIHRA